MKPVSLAMTYNPRGELPRLLRILPILQANYGGMVVVVPPDTAAEPVGALRERLGVGLVVSPEWSHGRYLALKGALALPGTHIQYADGDRLIRWVETRPAEWRRTVAMIPRHACLVIGRTEAAWDTHPATLRETERITTSLFSHILGQTLDISAGAKGFSREAAAFILAHSQPGRALGTDAEWVILAHRGGFPVAGVLVDGLDWETADRYQPTAADPARQYELRAAIDADPRRWAHRVAIANEIAQAGIEALGREIGDRGSGIGNRRSGIVDRRS